MKIFSTGYYQTSQFWSWFFITVLPAALPFIITGLTALNWSSNPDDYFKINDVIFMGLSLNISAINVWKAKLPGNVKQRGIAFAIGYLIVLTICLTLSYSREGISVAVSWFATTIVALSIAESLYIKRALEISKQKTKSRTT